MLKKEPDVSILVTNTALNKKSEKLKTKYWMLFN